MTLHLFGAPRSPCGNDEGPFSITLEGTTCVDCLRASALAGVAQIHGLEAALTALRAERDKWQSLLPAGLVEQNKHLERQLRIEIDNAQRAEADLAEARARLAGPVWQPIETAPKDSSRILIWAESPATGERRVYVAWWRLPYEDAPDTSCWWETDNYGGNHPVVPQFTKGWMPLPPPPAAEGETRCDLDPLANVNEMGTGNIK